MQVKPAWIINMVAYTAVNRAEPSPELTHQINAIAPGDLADAAQRIGAWLIHFSKDYVFDGLFTASPLALISALARLRVSREGRHMRLVRA